MKVKAPDNKKLKIKLAGNKGRGVFANHAFAKGDILEISPYIETQKTDYKKLKKTGITDYWYDLKDNCCAIGLGFTSLYNHSETANAKFIINFKHKTITIKVIKPILKGEEVLINYGYNPATWPN